MTQNNARLSSDHTILNVAIDENQTVWVYPTIDNSASPLHGF
ncbi:hypothetical protein [Sulfuriferula nivalis]|nr:hypothetical protein [Sulfuriferula nivalis]